MPMLKPTPLYTHYYNTPNPIIFVRIPSICPLQYPSPCLLIKLSLGHNPHALECKRA